MLCGFQAYGFCLMFFFFVVVYRLVISCAVYLVLFLAYVLVAVGCRWRQEIGYPSVLCGGRFSLTVG